MRALALVVAVDAMLVSGVAHAGPPLADTGKAIAESGIAGAPACGGCHGADGNGVAGVPRLAGLDAGYLGAQLAAFADGTRQNATMAGIAKAMGATASADVAAYYASLTPRVASPPSSKDPALREAGRRLADRGDWDAGIPPCASCHGPNGRGVGAAFPAVACQPAGYIAAQLKAWKSGARHDDPQGLMRSVAARMGDTQIAAAAGYYATLPATPSRETPP